MFSSSRLASGVCDANSIGKDFEEAKKSRSRGIRTWRTATRWNKVVLEGINNLRRFLFFRPLAPGKTAGQVSEASIRKKSVYWHVLLLARISIHRAYHFCSRVDQLIQSNLTYFT
jgi:hypothetical protein